jgi:hypothetical protein
MPGDQGDVLVLVAIIVNHDVPVAGLEDELQRRAVVDLLQPDHIGVQQLDHLLQLVQSIALGLNIGAKVLDVVRGHANKPFSACRRAEEP